MTFYEMMSICYIPILPALALSCVNIILLGPNGEDGPMNCFC